jgi:hypothetical protein
MKFLTIVFVSVLVSLLGTSQASAQTTIENVAMPNKTNPTSFVECVKELAPILGAKDARKDCKDTVRDESKRSYKVIKEANPPMYGNGYYGGGSFSTGYPQPLQSRRYSEPYRGGYPAPRPPSVR